MTAPEAEAILALSTSYLERQRWFQKASGNQLVLSNALAGFDVLVEGPPGLARLLLRRDERTFQLLVGWRRPSEVPAALRGEESALLGSITIDGESFLVYDAIADDALCIDLLSIVTGGKEVAQSVRRESSLGSHASLVFDERLFMKCYRVVDEGERPEIEMLFRLDGLGFNALLAPVARWHERDIDLALVREFLPTALEGRLLALTSLRDLLAHASLGEEPPSTSTAAHSARSQRVQIDSTPDEVCALAGGDLASEMQRLGQTTGSLHLALADAFGEHRVDVHALVDEMTVQGFTEDLETDQFGFREPNGSLQGLRDGLAVLAASNTGKAIRLHGEYHLRRVMRSDSGWIVVGFSDDPLYSRAQGDLSLAARMGSPLEDLADMCFSLGVVAREALLFRPPEEKALATDLALAWTRRNRAALLRGYLSTNGIESLVPEDPEAVGMLLSGYEIIREHRYDAASFD